MRKFFSGLLVLAACLYFTVGTAQAIDLYDGQLVIHGKISEQLCWRAQDVQKDRLGELYDYDIFHARSTLKLEAMWHAYKGPEYGSDAQTLRVHISHLRKKIEPHPSVPEYILTEPGVGFRLATR